MSDKLGYTFIFLEEPNIIHIYYSQKFIAQYLLLWPMVACQLLLQPHRILLLFKRFNRSRVL